MRSGLAGIPDSEGVEDGKQQAQKTVKKEHVRAHAQVVHTDEPQEPEDAEDERCREKHCSRLA